MSSIGPRQAIERVKQPVHLHRRQTAEPERSCGETGRLGRACHNVHRSAATNQSRSALELPMG
jgi:hypothetical protein